MLFAPKWRISCQNYMHSVETPLFIALAIPVDRHVACCNLGFLLFLRSLAMSLWQDVTRQAKEHVLLFETKGLADMFIHKNPVLEAKKIVTRFNLYDMG
ncbi:hypothetical protein H5410_011280 [Solanum commersonii]|uniref:Uncharacterized protein n=1 Tax=Solanum commersonii TaxID=4109 RepID=A0A9J6AN72_SOLCO|nr:hypothetical protein H5410_011280 [Solanum commersonii]